MAQCEHYSICNLDEIESTVNGINLCILHSHSSDKNKSKFAEALTRRLQSNSSDFSHFVFPKSSSSFRSWYQGDRSGKPLDFSNATFLGNANFSGFQFNGGGHFTNTRFCDEVTFCNAKFGHPTNFTETRFEKNVRFDSAIFDYEAKFIRTCFEADASFVPEVGGDPAVFKNKANFLGAKFAGRACFSRVSFEEDADFSNTEFNVAADFGNTRFMKHILFQLSKFRGPASFCGASFQVVALFRGAKDDPVFFDEVDFQRILLTIANILRFEDVDLGRARFLGSDIRLIEFNGVQWRRVGWRIAGRLGIHEEILVSAEPGSPSITDVEKLYRELKKNFEEHRDFERGADFHIGEKEMRLRNPRTPPSLKAILVVAKLLSGYGESFVRPLCWFFGSALYLSVVGLMHGLVDTDSKKQLDPSSLSDWASALFFAIEKSFHLSNAGIIATGVARRLQTIVEILGPVCVALFGLAVRNRLKR